LPSLSDPASFVGQDRLELSANGLRVAIHAGREPAEIAELLPHTPRASGGTQVDRREWYVRSMDPRRSQNEAAIDRLGVDRAQIRRMLELSPLERLRWLEEFMDSVMQIRRLNEKRAIR